MSSASVIWRYPDGRYNALSANAIPPEGSLKVAEKDNGVWSNRTTQVSKRTTKGRPNPNGNASRMLPVWLIEVLKDPADGRRWTVWSVRPIPGPGGWIYVHGEWPKRAEAEAAVMSTVNRALADRKGKFQVEFHVEKDGKGRRR